MTSLLAQVLDVKQISLRHELDIKQNQMIWPNMSSRVSNRGGEPINTYWTYDIEILGMFIIRLL